jgi:hypothetical protein
MGEEPLCLAISTGNSQAGPARHARLTRSATLGTASGNIQSVVEIMSRFSICWKDREIVMHFRAACLLRRQGLYRSIRELVRLSSSYERFLALATIRGLSAAMRDSEFRTSRGES